VEQVYSDDEEEEEGFEQVSGPWFFGGGGGQEVKVFWGGSSGGQTSRVSQAPECMNLKQERGHSNRSRAVPVMKRRGGLRGQKLKSVSRPPIAKRSGAMILMTRRRGVMHR
jgi:hypothetical protein